MKKIWPRLKKPMIWTAALTALSLLANFLLIRNFCALFTPVLGDIAPYFENLSHAVVSWEPLWMPLAVLAGFGLLYAARKHFPLAAVIAGILLLAAGLLLMRVNSVPVWKIISVVLTLVRGGVL